jgi:hypothetical protein
MFSSCSYYLFPPQDLLTFQEERVFNNKVAEKGHFQGAETCSLLWNAPWVSPPPKKGQVAQYSLKQEVNTEQPVPSVPGEDYPQPLPLALCLLFPDMIANCEDQVKYFWKKKTKQKTQNPASWHSLVVVWQVKVTLEGMQGEGEAIHPSRCESQCDIIWISTRFH